MKVVNRTLVTNSICKILRGSEHPQRRNADYASIRGTVGYSALTSRQNIIVSFGRDCEMLLSFCTGNDGSCNNNLRFDNKHSLQTDGTAIGSHLGMN
jgi:hypothetical protein